MGQEREGTKIWRLATRETREGGIGCPAAERTEGRRKDAAKGTHAEHHHRAWTESSRAKQDALHTLPPSSSIQEMAGWFEMVCPSDVYRCSDFSPWWNGYATVNVFDMFALANPDACLSNDLGCAYPMVTMFRCFVHVHTLDAFYGHHF